MRKKSGEGKGVSRRRFLGVGASTALLPASGLIHFDPFPISAKNGGTAEDDSRVDVIIGKQAPELERFAASELCRYLRKLFGIECRPTTHVSASSEAVFLVGSAERNGALKRATPARFFPKLSDQGILLKREELENRRVLIVRGGSPPATLWAVYELVERWGVRYLVDRDVLPERVGKFEIPNMDVVMEPVFRVRAHPTIQDFACSGESWGIEDFSPLIKQLAKLKFNRLNVYPFNWQPYLDWECRGIKRRNAWLWYDYHYSITPDTVGRELFGDTSEFWNRDLPLTSNYKELITAGERLMHNLIETAHRHGMECAVTAPCTSFTPEFAPLLKGVVRNSQLAGLTVVPGPETPLDDPGLFDLATAVLRTTVNTYPEADYVTVYMPEFRQWTGEYKRAWELLNAKYGIEKIRSLEEVLEAARHRKGGTWDPKRAEDQVKGDIASLYFYERLLRGSKVLKGTRHPDVKFMYWGVSEELFPILDHVLPHGWELGTMPDNFPTHLLERPEILKEIPAREIPSVIDLTVDDDNMGVVPQKTVGSLHKIIQDLKNDGWAGFVVRERFPGDHAYALEYLAKAAWDKNATPDGVARYWLRAACGEECVEDMLQVFHEIEAVTIIFESTNSAFAFPADWPPPTASNPGGMLLKYYKYKDPDPPPSYLGDIRSGYQRALDAARRAQAKVQPEGREEVKFWVGRLEFAVGYVETVEGVYRAAAAEAAKNRAEAIQQLQAALNTLEKAIRAYAQVARNQTDRGAIAVVNEHCYRPLWQRVWSLKTWGY